MNMKKSALFLAVLLISVSAGVLIARRVPGNVQMAGSEIPVSVVISSEPEPTNSPSFEKDIVTEAQKAFAKNSDCVGYLYAPNAGVDYAVYQYLYKAADPEKYKGVYQVDYYLEHNARKEKSAAGSIAADSACFFKELSKNTVLYGHDQNDGSMFGSLEKYDDLTFFNDNPTFDFATLTEAYKCRIFAVFFTDIDFNYIDTNPSDTDFSAIVGGALSRSEFIINVDVQPGDKIITLSTCTAKYKGDDKRFVVMARLLRPGEELTSEPAIKNPSPLRP